MSLHNLFKMVASYFNLNSVFRDFKHLPPIFFIFTSLRYFDDIIAVFCMCLILYILMGRYSFGWESYIPWKYFGILLRHLYGRKCVAPKMFVFPTTNKNTYIYIHSCRAREKVSMSVIERKKKSRRSINLHLYQMIFYQFMFSYYHFGIFWENIQYG